MRRNFYVLTPKFSGAIVNSIATHALLLFFSFVVKIKVANSCQLLKKWWICVHESPQLFYIILYCMTTISSLQEVTMTVD